MINEAIATQTEGMNGARMTGSFSEDASNLYQGRDTSTMADQVSPNSTAGSNTVLPVVASKHGTEPCMNVVPSPSIPENQMGLLTPDDVIHPDTELAPDAAIPQANELCDRRFDSNRVLSWRVGITNDPPLDGPEDVHNSAAPTVISPLENTPYVALSNAGLDEHHQALGERITSEIRHREIQILRAHCGELQAQQQGLAATNDTLRRQLHSLTTQNISLSQTNQALLAQNESLDAWHVRFESERTSLLLLYQTLVRQQTTAGLIPMSLSLALSKAFGATPAGGLRGPDSHSRRLILTDVQSLKDTDPRKFVTCVELLNAMNIV